jgi:hypothetical protein
MKQFKMVTFPKDKQQHLRVINDLVNEIFLVTKFHNKNNLYKIRMYKKQTTIMNFLII